MSLHAEAAVAPGDMAVSGANWCCNACSFRTVHTVEAVGHANRGAALPFEHIVYERTKPEARPTRRIVLVGGAARVEDRRRAA